MRCLFGGLLRSNTMKNLKFLILLIALNSIAQINAPGDCIDAYRLCYANVNYNFQLVDAGVIDDAKGTLFLDPLLGQTAPNQCEWKSAWIKFKPKYSGQFGLTICPETVEKLNYMLCVNPSCADIETGIYRIAVQGTSTIYDPIQGCTGIGDDPISSPANNTDWEYPMFNIQANQNYLLFVRTALFVQTGSHRFNLTFQGSAVSDHPDLFDDAACQLSSNEFVVKNNVTIYPNPFNEK